MKRSEPRACSTPKCGEQAALKGLCKRHYMAIYNRAYYSENRAEILAHQKQHGRSKQSA